MTQDRATPNNGERRTPHQKRLTSSYYGLLGLHPSASAQEIRQAYRDLSKLYHPDTTTLPAPVATSKFHALNEAYATLSSPERRLAYDQRIGYSRVTVVQPLPNLHQPLSQPRPNYSSSAYLDPTDRPLSPGELFALFILGITFIGCLVLAITIGLTRGDTVMQPLTQEPPSQIERTNPVSRQTPQLTATPPHPAQSPSAPPAQMPTVDTAVSRPSGSDVQTTHLPTTNNSLPSSETTHDTSPT